MNARGQYGSSRSNGYVIVADAESPASQVPESPSVRVASVAKKVLVTGVLFAGFVGALYALDSGLSAYTRKRTHGRYF